MKRSVTLVIQPSGNIRSIRNNDPKKGSAGEIRFTFTGGAMDTINTAHVPKIVTYYWDEETANDRDRGERTSVEPRR